MLPESSAENETIKQNLALVSSDHRIVDLDPHLRIWEFTETPEHNHVELAGGSSGDQVHERLFIDDPNVLHVLRHLGHRAVQEFRSSKKQEAEFKNPQN